MRFSIPEGNASPLLINNNMKTSDLKSILSPLKEYLEKVDSDIHEKLTSGIPLLDNSALHLFLKGGKKIRASLVILASGLYGEVPDGVIEIAAATEIVHGASLIHDDIIDQSLLRRGDITVPKKYGNKVAVLVGDYMYAVALNAAVSDGNPELFPVMVKGTRDMVKGEFFQLEYSNVHSITEEYYYAIVEHKTARFMAACAELGGVKADMSLEEREKLHSFGMNLGYAFQIIDDTLDLVDNPELTGKDVGNDFKEGKITLPFLYLLERSGDENRDLLVKYADNPDEEGWNIIKERLKESGAIDYSINKAVEFMQKSLDIITTFPETEFREILEDLSRFIIQRKY